MQDGDVYRGEFKAGRKHGQGEIRYSNGRRYVGSFKKGRKHGMGTYTLADGSHYEGFFEKGTWPASHALAFVMTAGKRAGALMCSPGPV
jgi:hypothetical protein